MFATLALPDRDWNCGRQMRTRHARNDSAVHAAGAFGREAVSQIAHAIAEGIGDGQPRAYCAPRPSQFSGHCSLWMAVQRCM
ncbi:hypothetical protein DM48_7244 [Burkholderia gladioli]|uniref:Transposase n=1 Tax=Burkholderia gladioli TaxID=28095 RepID=A0AAW3ETW2_BURGA|nr:hypothetical protein DM48_7244 [Burkholderia gladioli]